MTLIDEIVEVTIKHTSSPIARAGLNTLLIIGNSKKAHRVKLYANVAEVKADYEDNTAEYKAANLAFGQKGRPAKILIGQCLNAEKFVDAYPLIAQANNDFYGVMITSKKPEDQLAISELIEADEKIFGLSSSSDRILAPDNEGNILHKLHALKRKRTYVIYNKTAAETYPEAAWFGLMFSYEAGSATWGFKALSGIVADNLTANDRAAIAFKGGNYFVPFGSNNIMLDGRATSGYWLDALQGID